MGSGLESLPVPGGGDAEGADERAPHGLGRPVAAAPGDLLDPVAGVLQPAPGGFQANPVDVTARGHAGLGGEGAGELARGQAGPGGEAVHGQVGGGALGDPLLHLAQWLALRYLRSQLRAELSLAARAAQENHQVPGDGQRCVPADVLVDQRQGQVDARRDPGGGDD